MAVRCSALVHECPACEIRLPAGNKQTACPECGADLRCRNSVVPGYHYCAVHGGPAPSRNFYGKGRGMTTGKGSEFRITRIAAKYNEIQENGRILSNRNARDIIWKRVEELAERIDTNQAPERMARLQRLWVDYREKHSEGREMEAVIVARKIDDEFEAAYHDYAAWKQMFEALELHSKMTEGEVKIMKDLKAIMTYEDANLLVAKVMAVFLRILQDDPKKLKEAQYELTRLTGDFGDIVDEGFDQGVGSGSAEGAGVEGSNWVDREELLYPGDTGSAPETDGLSQGRDPGSPEPG